jgi:hypothetical protein
MSGKGVTLRNDNGSQFIRSCREELSVTLILMVIVYKGCD